MARQASSKLPTTRVSPRERQRIRTIFERFEVQTTHPKTELRYASPFTLVVAVALFTETSVAWADKATATTRVNGLA